MELPPDLLDRVAAIEDRLAIYNLIASHPPIVDSGADALMRAMFTADGVLDRGALGASRMAEPNPAAEQGMRAAREQGLAHMTTLPYLQVEQDRAVAINYVAATVSEPDLESIAVAMHGAGRGHRLFRLTANRWDLVRDGGRWRIERRSIVPVDGADDARALFRRLLESDEA